MTFEKICLRWSGSQFAMLAVWVFGGNFCLAAPYLPITGPVPLREASVRPTCVLSVNPPLVLDSSSPRLRTTPNAPAMTNTKSLDQSPPATAAAPDAMPEEPPFEYESVITHAGGPPPAEPPVAVNPPAAQMQSEPLAPPPITPQMLLPIILNRPHGEGRRNEPAVIMPVDFQPPAPASSGKSSVTVQSK